MDPKIEKLTVLMVEPERAPYVKEIAANLASLQHEVGGYIQTVYPFLDPVAVVCNEEGKLEGLPLNRALRDENGEIYDVISGNFFVVGLGEEDFASLTQDQVDKFSKLYQTPELFVNLNGKLTVFPMEERRAKKPSVLEQLEGLKKQETPGKKKTYEWGER